VNGNNNDDLRHRESGDRASTMKGFTATHPESFDHDSVRPTFESLGAECSVAGVAFFAAVLRGKIQRLVIATLNEGEP
jgi:hypothetical protein